VSNRSCPVDSVRFVKEAVAREGGHRLLRWVSDISICIIGLMQVG